MKAFVPDFVQRSAKPGSPAILLAKAENALGQRLPEDLKDHLSRVDACEGFLASGRYLMFWPLAELVELNSGYEVAKHLPGIVVFATDGSDEGYGFRWMNGSPEYVKLSLMGLDMEPVSVLGNSLAAMTRSLAATSA